MSGNYQERFSKLARSIGKEVSEIVDLISKDLAEEATKKGVSLSEAKEKLKANIQSFLAKEVADEVDDNNDDNGMDFYAGAAKIQTILSSTTSDFDERVNAALSSGWKIGEVFYKEEKLIAVMYKTKGS